MKSINHFRRFVRKEVGRISMAIKQIELRIMCFRGLLKRRLREELRDLRRMKNTILSRLSKLTYDTKIHTPVVQEILADIATLQERCRNLKAKYL